jgi:hypothetical protein
MRTSVRVGQLTAFAALALAATLGVAARADNNVTHEATLVTSGVDPDAHGRARFEMRERNRLRFEVEVEDVFSSDAAVVLVNGDPVGVMDLNGGQGELRLETENGDDVPVINTGDIVDIINADDGTLLLEGVFN